MLILDKIQLINFRNYDKLDLLLNDKINIFLGKNGQGKTNLLESIYMGITGKSFKTHRDSELIKKDRDYSYIKTSIKNDNQEKIIEIQMSKEKAKIININKIELQNYKDFYSSLPVVLFYPEDLKLVKDGPSERRNYLDLSISQIRPVYKYNINRYNKILYNRNNILKFNKYEKNLSLLLEVYDIQLASIGSEIILARKEFIDNLYEMANTIHNKLTYNKEELTIHYNSNIDYNGFNKAQIERNFTRKLQENYEKDISVGSTEYGPHRDDMLIKLNDMNTRLYSSQGQQRTIVMSLKLSEVELIKRDKGISPILLLDDVFSELDIDRRRFLIKTISDMQTVITTTDIDLEELNGINKSVYLIHEGKVKR